MPAERLTKCVRCGCWSKQNWGQRKSQFGRVANLHGMNAERANANMPMCGRCERKLTNWTRRESIRERCGEDGVRYYEQTKRGYLEPLLTVA